MRALSNFLASCRFWACVWDTNPLGKRPGGKIVRAKQLMHGKVDRIHHHGGGLFEGLPNPFEATRYHSLVIEPSTLSPEYEVTAWADAPDGSREIMGIRHKKHPTFGVQFHPERFSDAGVGLTFCGGFWP